MNTGSFAVSIGKVDESITFDRDMIAPDADNRDDVRDAVDEYVYQYGLNQLFNDCHAGVTNKSHPDDQARYDAVMKKVEAKRAALYAGELPGRKAPADPKAAFVRRVVKLAAEKGIDLGAMDMEDVLAALGAAAE